MKRLAILGLLPLAVACGTSPDVRPFVERRAAFRTELVRHGPSLQEGTDPTGPGIELVRYRSGALTLKGWLVRPRSSALMRGGRAPLLLYLHGGYAVDGTDVTATRELLDAGFAVMIPAYRGENGNPGDHEMLFGELDDARAALDHARRLRGVDPDRIVIFGHSAGAVLSALLAMSPDLAVVETGGAGGLYDATVFDGMALPFRDTPEERAMRVPAPHVTELRQHHWACAGTEDAILPVAREAESRAIAAGAPLELTTAPGDHQASLAPCVRAYLSHVLPMIERVPARAVPEETEGPPEVAGARPVATGGSFDLVLRDGGALVVWAAPHDPGIHAQPIGPEGELAGEAATIATLEGQIREIAAAVSGDRLAVAWTQTDGMTATLHARAATGPIAGPLEAQVELGELDLASVPATRGNLAVVARPTGFVAAARTTRGTATEIAIVPLGEGARGGRRSIALERPCARAIVGALRAGDDAVLGLCDGGALVRAQIGDGAPMVTRAEAGCEELALADAGGEQSIVRCEGPRLLTQRTLELQATCEDTTPRFGTAIALRAPASGLAALLPDAMVGPGARAVWTGRALLVAVRDASDLAIRRSQCRGALLERTDVP